MPTMSNRPQQTGESTRPSTNEPYDEESSRLISELSSYGVTVNQAKIYIFLLANGATPARRISEMLGLHRVDVYRKLKEMEGSGLVELHLSSPNRYVATSPKGALSLLLQNQEQKLRFFKQKSATLAGRLDKLRNNIAIQPRIGTGGEDGSTYKLVLGQKRYIYELRKQLRGSRQEVLRIVSAGGVVRTFLAGMDKAYLEAKQRGVSLRMITEVTPQNRMYVRRLSRTVRIRHLEGVHLRFVVVDGSVAIIGAKFDENSMSLNATDNSYLVFKDQKLAEAFRFFFEHLWNGARPLSPQ